MRRGLLGQAHIEQGEPILERLQRKAADDESNAECVKPPIVAMGYTIMERASGKKLFSTGAQRCDVVKAGTLELVGRSGETVKCELILMSEWRTAVETRLETPN